MDGLSLLLPPEAGALRRTEAALASMLESLGFDEVRLPIIELADNNDEAGMPGGPIKFALPGGFIGRLSSDMTRPCAKLAIRELASKPRPLRLFYTGPVFRRPGNRDGLAISRQDLQLGAEIYGHDGLKAGLEALGAAIGICRFAKEAVQLRIGDISLLDQLLLESGLDGLQMDELRQALMVHDISSAMSALTKYGKGNKASSMLRKLIPSNCDEAAIKGLEGIVREYPATKLAEEALRASLLLDGARMVSKGVGIAFELGLLRPLDYYNGPVFEAYVNGYGRPMLGGGQYDGLMRSLGSDEGGIGFALDMGMLMEIRPEGVQEE